MADLFGISFSWTETLDNQILLPNFKYKYSAILTYKDNLVNQPQKLCQIMQYNNPLYS